MKNTTTTKRNIATTKRNTATTKRNITKRNIIKRNTATTTWKNILEQWSAGQGPVYPSDIKKRFFYETSILKKDISKCEYKEIFIESKELDSLVCDPTAYKEHIEKAKNKNEKAVATSFPNLSGDSLLIVPLSSKTKQPCQYTTIKDFIDNAPPSDQKGFWKFASREIKKRLKKRDHIYVSTHGKGIPYFHLRLDDTPKYYQTTSFTK
jgi:hypothetical protein